MYENDEDCKDYDIEPNEEFDQDGEVSLKHIVSYVAISFALALLAYKFMLPQVL